MFLRELTKKKNHKEFENFKVELHYKVKQRVKENTGRNISLNPAEDRTLSRRSSSRLSGKKRNNYSEESENYNFYLLLELINETITKNKQKSNFQQIEKLKPMSSISKLLNENWKEETKNGK